MLDAFDNVAGGEVPRFFENVNNSNRGIILTDNFYKLFEGEIVLNGSFTTSMHLFDVNVDLRKY